MSAVLFDLDATLLDLPVDIEPARRLAEALFRARGWSRPLRPILPAITEAAAAVTSDPDERRRLIAEARAFIDRAEVLAAARAMARPGAAEAVSALAGQGRALGIVTDNGRACIDPALARTGLGRVPWRVVVTRDEVHRSKPDPGGIEQAAAALLPDGGPLWVVGDSPRDMQAAVAAAVAGVVIHPIGITGGRGDRAALVAAGATEVVDRLAAVVDLISRVASRAPSG
jgi:phosphoglycolate phosphatase-like HAD superfamily hydrolase